MNRLPFERLLLSVPATAAIERAVELTVKTHSSTMPSVSALDVQNTRFKLAECANLAHVVGTFLNDRIQRLLDKTLDHEAAYMAKWWCTERRGKVTDECLQLFGVMVTWLSTRSRVCTPTYVSSIFTAALLRL